ncbi:dnaJ domain-containing protein [Ditylenchus destructor]|nr:dnaJ domain-containing protein [Ditylenchus destructor]
MQKSPNCTLETLFHSRLSKLDDAESVTTLPFAPEESPAPGRCQYQSSAGQHSRREWVVCMEMRRGCARDPLPTLFSLHQTWIAKSAPSHLLLRVVFECELFKRSFWVMYEVQMVPYFSYFSVVVLAYHYVMADNKRQEVERHMEMGKVFLSKGQFSDALQHYHAAAELDPSDYQIFYRRATVLLAQGKMKAALPDLHRVVELKPDFIAGRVQRGNILFKQGQLSDSAEDFRFAVKHEPEHADAKDKLEKISQVQEWIDTAMDYFENDDFNSAEKYLDSVIEHVHWDADLHRKRSKCRLARGDVHNALADIRAVAKLVPDSTEIYLEMAEMYYGVGDVENSLMQIRECLKLNPDHKLCFPFYKKIKKLAKMREGLEKAAKAEQWTDCLKKGEEILKLEKKIDGIQYDVYRHTCKCNMKQQHIAEALQQCSTALKYGDENDLDLLLDRGEAYLLDEQYDRAIEDFQQAAKAHDDSRRAKEALNRAQKLAKQAKKKDYYKILGLRRNADKRDVMKAYRKLAQKWHPDNFQDDDEKKRAQDKFIDIANAKEVLTDPEKRQRYDNGEDPLDPESQQNGHHAWHQQWGDVPFGSHFGGGQQGYSFKFNFG